MALALLFCSGQSAAITLFVVYRAHWLFPARLVRAAGKRHRSGPRIIGFSPYITIPVAVLVLVTGGPAAASQGAACVVGRVLKFQSVVALFWARSRQLTLAFTFRLYSVFRPDSNFVWNFPIFFASCPSAYSRISDGSAPFARATAGTAECVGRCNHRCGRFRAIPSQLVPAVHGWRESPMLQPNNAFERSVGHRGPRLAAARRGGRPLN